MGNIKVCHLVSGDLWAGAEVQVYNILSGLKELDNFKLFAVLMNEGRLYDELSRLGINVQLLDEKKHSLLKQIILLGSMLKENGIDILHSHRYKENILSALTAFLLGNRCLLVKTQHGSTVRLSTRRVKLYYFVERILSRRFFSGIVAVSNDIAKELGEYIPLSRIQTIRNSIQPQSYPTPLRRTFRGRSIRIGIAGRMVPIKRVDEFIKIAIKAREEGLICEALIAGEGPLLNELKRQVETCCASSYIKFLGQVDDISGFFNKVDIVFITSSHEGIPTVVLEAWWFGSIVVAKPVGGIPEVLEDGATGFFYKRTDEALRVLRFIKNNPKVVDKIRADAQFVVSHLYTHKLQALEYARLYRKCIGMKLRRSFK